MRSAAVWQVMRYGREDAKAEAVTALAGLSLNSANHPTLVTAAVLEQLVELATCGDAAMKSTAGLCLAVLTNEPKTNRRLIAAAGAVCPLIELTRCADSVCQNRGTRALANLVEDDERLQRQVT